MLDNKWRNGSLYKVVQSEAENKQPNIPPKPPSFKWSPSFADVWQTVESSPPQNDGLTVREGCTSVTPLRANFESLWGENPFKGDLNL